MRNGSKKCSFSNPSVAPSGPFSDPEVDLKLRPAIPSSIDWTTKIPKVIPPFSNFAIWATLTFLWAPFWTPFPTHLSLSVLCIYALATESRMKSHLVVHVNMTFRLGGDMITRVFSKCPQKGAFGKSYEVAQKMVRSDFSNRLAPKISWSSNVPFSSNLVRQRRIIIIITRIC